MEAHLRAIVDSEIAPIEERVRAMVVDIVRTSQSTVARNFNLTIAPMPSADDRTQPHSQTVTLAELGTTTREELARLPRDDTADNPSDLYREPPHLSTEASTISPDPVHSVPGSQNLSSDSGYSSLPNTCACFCHDYPHSWSTARDTANSKKLPNCALDFPLMK